jgi:hypothetical protein
MHALVLARLDILPGNLLVVFLVQLGTSLSAVAVPPREFLHGLTAACQALAFNEICRDDGSVEDLLPWTGNV